MTVREIGFVLVAILLGFGFLIAYMSLFTTDKKGVVTLVVGVAMMVAGTLLALPEILSKHGWMG